MVYEVYVDQTIQFKSSLINTFTVATLTERDALAKTDGMSVFVKDTGQVYILESDLTTWTIKTSLYSNYDGPVGYYLFDPSREKDFVDGYVVSQLTNYGSGSADGYHATQSAVSDMPVFMQEEGKNGPIKTVTFGGISDSLLIEGSRTGAFKSFYDTGVIEIYMLLKFDRSYAESVPQRVLSQATSTGDGPGFDFDIPSGDGDFNTEIYSSGGRILSPNTLSDKFVPGKWYLMEIIGDGTNISIKLAGSAETFAMSLGNLGTGTPPNELRIFSRRDGLANWAAGSLAFMAVFDSALTETQRTTIRAAATRTGLL